MNFEEAFYAAEEEALGFLVRDHGFRALERMASEEDGFAYTTYVQNLPPEPANTYPRYVTLTMEPLRPALDLSIANEPGDTYTVAELYRLVRDLPMVPFEHNLSDEMHDPAQMAAEFTRLADVLRQCGARFFGGDHTLWADLHALRVALAHEQQDQRALAAADTAFHAHDWHQVAELLRPMEGRLHHAEAAKLAHAEKRLREEARRA
ncbi:MAG: hypothetical protein K1X53_01405 [Candidatus Sumerlaeaceae bacterium]|nr:hypothetical protein [Candidatus Sumerlaeaceae bacterium]